MISQAWRGVMFGIASTNVNTIEFSMMEQSSVNGDTPPTFDGSPTSPGVPLNSASMCGTLPGSTSVTVTPNRDQMPLKQLTVSVQFCADGAKAGTATAGFTMIT